MDSAGVVGNPEAGKQFWESLPTSSCKNCHGIQGQGAFAPPLAGRGLTTEDFIRAITHPAIMPEFPQYNAQHMADFAAHFARQPAVTAPGPWRYPMPSDAGGGLMVAFAIGCPQCHGPELETPRHSAGAVFADADFEWFKTDVYNHPEVVKDYWALLELPNPPPYVRMGKYSPDRLPESVLEQIWGWMTEEGLLTPLTASLPQPELTSAGAVYTLTLINQGARGKGLVADDVSVRLVLPSGAEVVAAAGEGYQGIEPDPESGAAAAVWELATIGPHDRAEISLTLAQAGTKEDDVRGYATWPGQDTKQPERLNLRTGQRPRNMP
jgi:mono/diheme cytochrome c family protein